MNKDTLTLDRIGSEALREKIVSAEEASLLIKDGMAIGLSGFAGAGDAKAVPLALAERVQQSGEKIRISVFTGASLGLAVETALSDADLIEFRAPYQTNPSMRKRINKAETKFTDINLGGFSRMSSLPDTIMRLKTSPRRWTDFSMRSHSSWATVDFPEAIRPVIRYRVFSIYSLHASRPYG